MCTRKRNRFFLFLCLVISVNTYGQDVIREAVIDTLPVFRSSEILVVADRAAVVKATAFHEIKADQISRIDAHNPGEALQFVPGLHVYRMSKNEYALNLRGFEQRQISVFFDGVPVSVPYDGQVDLSQLGGDNIGRIRVSRGASSALYGANTLGGSINIMSSSFENPARLQLRLEASDHDSYYGGLNYHNTFKKLNYSFFVNWEKSDDFKLSSDYKSTANEDGKRRDNSAFENQSAGLKLQYQLSDKHRIGFNYSYINNDYNIPPNAGTERVRYWQFPEWQKNILSVNSQHIFSKNFLLRSVLYYDQYYNMLKSYDNDSYSSQDKKYAWNSAYDDYSLGVILYPTIRLFSFGSTNGMVTVKKDVHKQEFRDFGFDTYEMGTFTAAVEQDFVINSRHSASIGSDVNYLEALAAEDLELRDPILLLNGQLAYQFKATDNLSIHASAGKKSRFPTLKELYSERIDRNIPNPELKEEHSYSVEVGVTRSFKSSSIGFALFHNTLHDLIATKQLGDGSEQLQNIGLAELKGAELELNSRFKTINSVVNYTFIQARNLSNGRPSQYLENRPCHRLNFMVNWAVTPALNLLTEALYVADQHYEQPDKLQWLKFDDYSVVNLKLNYRVWEHLNWYVRINNLMDADYENDFGTPMPGRKIISGIRFSL